MKEIFKQIYFRNFISNNTKQKIPHCNSCSTGLQRSVATMWVLGNHRVLAWDFWSSLCFGWAFVQDKRTQWDVVGETKNKIVPFQIQQPSYTTTHFFSFFNVSAQIGAWSPHFEVIKSRTVRQNTRTRQDVPGRVISSSQTLLHTQKT